MATEIAVVTWNGETGSKTATYSSMTGTYGVDWGIVFGLMIPGGGGPLSPFIVSTPAATSAVISPGVDVAISATVTMMLIPIP